MSLILIRWYYGLKISCVSGVGKNLGIRGDVTLNCLLFKKTASCSVPCYYIKQPSYKAQPESSRTNQISNYIISSVMIAIKVESGSGFAGVKVTCDSKVLFDRKYALNSKQRPIIVGSTSTLSSFLLVRVGSFTLCQDIITTSNLKRQWQLSISISGITSHKNTKLNKTVCSFSNEFKIQFDQRMYIISDENNSLH